MHIFLNRSSLYREQVASQYKLFSNRLIVLLEKVFDRTPKHSLVIDLGYSMTKTKHVLQSTNPLHWLPYEEESYAVWQVMHNIMAVICNF